MSNKKHEIYFDKVDFLQMLKKYQDNQASIKTQEQLLLVAKGYFIQQLYTECISLLRKIPHNKKAKILFEKQALLFKATYLSDPHNINQLKTIIEQFESSKGKINDKPFNQYHHNVFKQFREFLESQKLKSSSFIQEKPKSEQRISQKKQQGDQIIEMEKRLQKIVKIQGFPCFLVENNWRIMQLNYYGNKKNVRKFTNKTSKISYVTEDPIYPGPITNFSIINHIFQIIPHQKQSNSNLNVILFPGEQYEVMNKLHWQYLNKTYGGIPIRRTYQAVTVTRFSNDVTYNEKMMLKILIKFRDNLQILQVPSTYLWEINVIKKLWKQYGMGQLKEQYSQNNYKLVGEGKVYQPESEKPLKFVAFQNHNVSNLTSEELKFQNKMFYKFDFEKYLIQNSPSKGLVGLTNDKFFCFMNSTLQCLSNTYDLSQFFLHNQYIRYLNFSKSNHTGSRGQITCAYADIIKKLWSLNTQNQRENQINPSVFKQVFAKRFQNFVDDSQEDAHQFLNFLLNCIHDDLNSQFQPDSKRALKPIKDSTNFDEVRKIFTENYESNNLSKITQLFKGYTYSKLKCLNCETKYYNFDTHLTFPLPVSAPNPSIPIYFLSNKEKQGETLRYNVLFQKMKNVGDILKKIQEKQNYLSPTNNHSKSILSEKQYYFFGLQKQTYKLETHYELDTPIQKLINNQEKFIFLLYCVTKSHEKNKQNPHSNFDNQFEDSQQNSLNSLKLVLVEYFYGEQRKGFPKLIYLDTQSPEQRILQIVAQGLPDQALNYSGGVATEKEKIESILKLKFQKVKGKPFQSILKVKLNKNLSLSQQKIKVESIGQLSQITQSNLENSFNIFQQKDIIQQEQGWVCGKCKKVSACQKSQKIYSVGKSLILVLKRFKEGQKINTKIQYPIQNLDISRYVDDSFKTMNPNAKFIYDLYGVIIHRGSLNRGHYYSYCKNKQTKKWYLFDDELVKEETNLQTIVSQNAYVLFYSLKEK